MKAGKILKSVKKKVDKDDNLFYEVNVQYICNSYDEATELVKDLGVE